MPVGTFIAVSVIGLTAGTFAAAATAFAINIVASAIISKAFFSSQSSGGSSGAFLPANSDANNPGQRQQVPPAGDNKLPVIYGAAYTGGIVTDLSISSDSQDIYYVLSLCEVTNTESGSTPDAYTFGNIYWAGRRVTFSGSAVISLTDESTGMVDTTVNGKLDMYLYSNGSYSGTNTSRSAIDVMSTSGLTYQWDGTKTMTNTAFAIIHMRYSQSANLRGLEQTRFQVINSRAAPGDCFNDYLTSARYGAGLLPSQVDYTSITALNLYCAQSVTYTTYAGMSATLTPRFRFDGLLDTSQTVMTNLTVMAACCDCLIRYNEITGLWGVIVQQPTYTVAANLDDSNIVSAISISTLDISSSLNVAEVKYNDSNNKDSFSAAIFDLKVINPSLLFPNEPINKQSFNLNLVNNDVRAQILANRFLEGAREDLQVQIIVGYIGLQFEAGDIVTLTNVNYGWSLKLFRISKVVERFSDDGTINTLLSLMEVNFAVWDDQNITQFTPSVNSGLGAPNLWSAVAVPIVGNSLASTSVPSFDVTVYAPTTGVTQYAEIWYSAFSNPSDTQRIFYGTTQVRPSGNPYTGGMALPITTVTSLPEGDYYFFTRMVNAISSSSFSGASALFQWRPLTLQFSKKFLSVAYADDMNGTGFSLVPTNKTYFGLSETDAYAIIAGSANYRWYPANPIFGNRVNFLLYANRGSRKFSFGSGMAALAAGTGEFIPTQLTLFDPTIWEGLLPTQNVIDLDSATGQVISTGTTSVGAGSLAVVNSNAGQMLASLSQAIDLGVGINLNSIPAGNISALTIDQYGRVLGITPPDTFAFTDTHITATANQTVFTIARPTQATYILGNDLVFQNGCLLSTTEYIDAATTVTLTNPAAAGDKISVISFAARAANAFAEFLYIVVSSVSGNLVYFDGSPYQEIKVGDLIVFGGGSTTYTVTGVDYTNKIIGFSANVTGVNIGDVISRFHANGSSYNVITVLEGNLTNAATFSSNLIKIVNGYEYLFVNGVALGAEDYDINNSTIAMKSPVTGRASLILFARNNLSLPAGSQTITTVQSVANQLSYEVNVNPVSFQLSANGLLQVRSNINSGTFDYTTFFSFFTLQNAYPDNRTGLGLQVFSVFD